MKARRLELKDLGDGWKYKDMIGLIVGAPEVQEQTGQRFPMNYAEVVRRGNLIDDLESADGVLLMDEAKYELLSRLTKSFNWSAFSASGILNKKALDNIRAFVTELENVELTEVEAKVGTN